MASHQRRSRLSRPRGAAPDAAAPSPALTADVIIAIAALLTTLEDFFALRAACRFYRAGLTPRRSTLASQPPLLLLYTNSTTTSDAASYYEALFHLPLRRLLRCRLPWGNPPSHHTLFYAHGFLITAYRNYRELLLLNLFSGEQIRLPVAPAPFSRVVLSRGLLTVLFWPRSRTVQHCCPGDALWCVASIDATQVLMDLLFVNGTLYALLGEGCRLAVVHLLENSLELSFLGGESDELSRQPGMTFMLGECGGEVLLISKDGMEYRAFRWVFREGK